MDDGSSSTRAYAENPGMASLAAEADGRRGRKAEAIRALLQRGSRDDGY